MAAFDVIDNLLQAPTDELKGSAEEFNTSAR